MQQISGEDPRICIPNKFPGGVYTASKGPHFEDHYSVQLLMIYYKEVIF